MKRNKFEKLAHSIIAKDKFTDKVIFFFSNFYADKYRLELKCVLELPMKRYR